MKGLKKNDRDQNYQSIEEVNKIIDLLINYEVFPNTFEEILDDLSARNLI